ASRKNNYYIDLSTLNDAFIIIDRGEIAHLKSHTYVRFPDEINNPPENWELVKLYNSSLDSKFLFLLDMIEKICPVILKGKVSEKIQGTINKSKKPIPVEIYYIP
ncbi:hypothetical protein KY312_00930, partial [Candidatus Woesearchaeota archaeon]|nr:hypothetical protein [Candidatus Woesearchaeota archaeon]